MLTIEQAKSRQGKWRKAKQSYTGAPFRIRSYECRWIEKPSAVGLRETGKAEDIARLRHSGWYLDDTYSETAHGLVFQLPTRKGQPRYFAAMADPHNDGPALVEIGDIYDSAEEAARAADGLAERYAEGEREYNDAWQRGNTARAKASEARELCRAWIETMRAVRASFKARKALQHTEARQLVKASIRHARQACEVFIEARDEARELRNDAPTGEFRSAWRNGYQSY